MRRTRPWKALLLTGALAGCASGGTIPASRIAAPEAAIRAAHEVGAQRDPRAALHLKFAEDQLQQAKALNAAGEAGRASLLLKKAQADADLALALTKQASERSTAQQMIEQLELLQQQTPGGR